MLKNNNLVAEIGHLKCFQVTTNIIVLQLIFFLICFIFSTGPCKLFTLFCIIGPCR